jgi:hypothetical protein
MKHELKNAKLAGSALLCLAILIFSSPVASFRAHAQNRQSALTAQEQETVTAFEKRVKDYVKMRENLEEKLPKLSKEAEAEEIKAHLVKFTDMVREARVGAKRGDIFTPDITEHIRAVIKREFKGKDRAELRQTVFEAETKGVPLRINYPYPETKELVNIPPTLLLALPELPKQMRYRFVGKYMLLMDRENHLIIDFMPNALP